MKRQLYRTIAWLCIIAHLNFIMPTAHAMHVEDDVAYSMSTVSIKPQFDQDLEPSSYMNTLWSGAAFLVGDILPLVICEDPFSYGLYVAAKILLEQSLETSPTQVVKKTLHVVQDTSRAVVSAASVWPLFALPVINALEINGGPYQKLSYRDCPLWYLYHNDTAPFVIGFNSTDDILTTFIHGKYDPSLPYPVGVQNGERIATGFSALVDSYIFNHPGSMKNATVQNFTRLNDTFPTILVSFIANPKTIADFLSGLQVLCEKCETYLTNFSYSTLDNESLINASRIYSPMHVPPDGMNPIVVVMCVMLAGFAFVGVAYAIYHECKICKTKNEMERKEEQVYITTNRGSSYSSM